MALWHDPLDELIADLERTLPPDAGPVGFDQPPPLWPLQLLVQACIRGTEADRARVERDPRVQAVMTWLERIPPRDARGKPIGVAGTKPAGERSEPPKPR